MKRNLGSTDVATGRRGHASFWLFVLDGKNRPNITHTLVNMGVFTSETESFVSRHGNLFYTTSIKNDHDCQMLNQEYACRYQCLIDELKNNRFVLAAILSGSQARGLSHRFSDTDMYIIVSDELNQDGLGELRETIYRKYSKLVAIDLSLNAVQSLSSFKSYARIGTRTAWDRYALVHAVLEFDKLNGEINKILRDKQTLTNDEKQFEVKRAFPSYLNYVYRSTQSLNLGDRFAGQLDASQSIQFLVRALFALHNRVAPFNKFLEWELTHYPLEAIDSDELCRRLNRISRKASLRDQQVCARLVGQLARYQGFGRFVDQWGKKLAWI